MAIAVFPVTLFSAASTKIVLRRSAIRPTFLILLAAGLSVSSVYAFFSYMTALIPGVNWWHGSWRPAIATLAAVFFEVLASRRVVSD